MRKLIWVLTVAWAAVAMAAEKGEEVIPIQDEEYGFELKLEPGEGTARLETRRTNGQRPSSIRLRVERDVEPPVILELKAVERHDPRFPVYEARTKPFGGSYVAVAVELQFPAGPKRTIRVNP